MSEGNVSDSRAKNVAARAQYLVLLFENPVASAELTNISGSFLVTAGRTPSSTSASFNVPMQTRFEDPKSRWCSLVYRPQRLVILGR